MLPRHAVEIDTHFDIGGDLHFGDLCKHPYLTMYVAMYLAMLFDKLYLFLFPLILSIIMIISLSSSYSLHPQHHDHQYLR
jgi:hypothetical protein